MVIMGRVISKDGTDTWRRARLVHRGQIFSSFLLLCPRNGPGVISASRLSIRLYHPCESHELHG